MTVAEVWGRIQAQNVVPIATEGDTWLFQVPRSVIGRVLCEFWVSDEAGNVGYKAGIFQIEHGTIKCIEWLKTGEITSLPIERPTIEEIKEERSIIEFTPAREITDITERPLLVELPHICPKMEG